jgi:hypothetical protein
MIWEYDVFTLLYVKQCVLATNPTLMRCKINIVKRFTKKITLFVNINFALHAYNRFF